MKINLEIIFRVLFIIGLLLLFLSMFLDWYYVQVVNNQGKLTASWGYNPFFEWRTIISNDKTFVRPPDLLMPIIIHIIFLITVGISGYIVLFNDVEHKDDLEKLYPCAYIIFFLIVTLDQVFPRHGSPSFATWGQDATPGKAIRSSTAPCPRSCRDCCAG